jgi:hypothetical protein
MSLPVTSSVLALPAPVASMLTLPPTTILLPTAVVLLWKVRDRPRLLWITVHNRALSTITMFEQNRLFSVHIYPKK